MESPSFAEDPQKLWELHLLAKAYNKTPSELIGVQDEVAGFCLNRGVWLFGTSLEDEIDKATAKLKKSEQIRSKSQQVLNKWLAKPGEILPGTFRDPMTS